MSDRAEGLSNKLHEPSTFWLFSGAFFVVGLIISYSGMAVFKAKLLEIHKNPIIGNFIYSTFIIIIIEWVLERFNSSIRKPGGAAPVRDVEQTGKDLQALEQLTISSTEEILPLKMKLNRDLIANETKLACYKHGTRRSLLTISLVIGGSLSA